MARQPRSSPNRPAPGRTLTALVGVGRKAPAPPAPARAPGMLTGGLGSLFENVFGTSGGGEEDGMGAALPLILGLSVVAGNPVRHRPSAHARRWHLTSDPGRRETPPAPPDGRAVARVRDVPRRRPGQRRPAGPETGFADGLYESSSASERDLWFDRTVDASAGIVRINVVWRESVSGSPDDPQDPADPAYEFGSTDAAVVDATQRGLDVMFTVYQAPNFAEGANRPGSAPPGTWKPKPADYADFGHAVATRYPERSSGCPGSVSTKPGTSRTFRPT